MILTLLAARISQLYVATDAGSDGEFDAEEFTFGFVIGGVGI